MISMRDYAKEERGVNLVKPYGVRIEAGKRFLISQVWDFSAEHYDLTFYFVEEDLETKEVKTHTIRSKYYAIPTEKMCALMTQAGFVDVRRVDGAYYQPVLIGHRASQ